MQFAAKSSPSMFTLPSPDSYPRKPIHAQTVGRTKRFLLASAGCNVEVLLRDECATDLAKHVALGSMVICTAITAAISASFALFTVFHSLLIASFFGSFWGYLISCLERVFITTIRKSRSKSVRPVLMALPRIAIAVCVSAVVSTPLELKIFEPEIDFQLASDEVHERAAHEHSASVAFPEIARLEDEKKQRQNEISDSQSRRDSAYKDAVAEAEGLDGTLLRGLGRVYYEKRAYLDTRTIELNSVRERNEARIRDIDLKLFELRAARDTAVSSLTAAQHRGRGILARIRALHEIAADGQFGTILSAAVRFIFLLFVMIETAPVLAKIFVPVSVLQPVALDDIVIATAYGDGFQCHAHGPAGEAEEEGVGMHSALKVFSSAP